MRIVRLLPLLLAPLVAVAQAWLPDEPAMRAALAARPVPPKTYYVSPTGSDQNDGLSPSLPLRTPQRAADRTEPGDVVEFMNGTFPYSGPDIMLNITRSGAPDAWITYRAHPGHRPVFTATNGWEHIRIQSAYIIIDGLVIEGNSRAISHEEAMRNYESVANPPEGARPNFQRIAYSNTNGISVDGRENRRNGRRVPHHVIIRNCTVAYAPGGGINTNEADYVLIENNLVHDNAHTMVFGGSGISVFHSKHIDTNMDDYKQIVRGNRVFRNETRVPWLTVRRISDGNGIIVDDLRNTQIQGAPYIGRTLVINNISYENGGSGIHAFSSDHVDIINNTVYDNNKQLPWGNLFVSRGADCLVLNNIVVVREGGILNGNQGNDRVIFARNLYFGAEPRHLGFDDRVADPRFVDLAARDFRLLPDSPAIDQGTSTRAPSVDITGAPRPRGAGIDLGAHESEHSATPLLAAELDLPAILKTFVFNPPVAEAMPGTPVIDGQIDAIWASTQPIPVARPTAGLANRPGAAVGTARVLWDATHLHVLVEVTDDQLSDAASAPHEQDSVEVFLDQKNERASRLGAGSGQHRVNFRGVKSRGSNVRPEDFQAAAATTATGYVAEFSIPLTHVKGAPGLEIGLDLQVNDGSPEGKRVGASVWSDVQGGGWATTTRYGILRLVERLSEAAMNVE
jgi:hypothetical protein